MGAEGRATASANPSELADALRASEAFRNKCRIGPATGAFAALSEAFGIRNGDDAAVIPHGGEYLLLAAEGIRADLVRTNPYLAGVCAVLTNVNDIYAMGGYPMAMVDVVGTPEEGSAREICRGMLNCAARYRVPVVGGHLLSTERDFSVSLAVLGRAKRCITSFDARPGDHLLLVGRKKGVRTAGLGFWNCTLPEDDATLTADLELLPHCAEQGLIAAGKDVSMAGIAGTALMLAETSGAGVDIRLDDIAVPPGYSPAEWLLAFMSYGFLLAVHPDKSRIVSELFRTRGLRAAVIGEFRGERAAWLCGAGRRHMLWDFAEKPFIGARA
jgi:selenophosphate synthetase-related protein